MEAFLLALCTKILQWLLTMAGTAVVNKAKEMADESERGKINDENVKAYAEAQERKARVEKAIDMLNRLKR